MSYEKDIPVQADDALRIEHGVVLSCRKNVTKVTVPDGTVGISPEAFTRCNVQEVILPPSVQWIGDEAFGFCHNLTRLVLPEGLTRIPTRMCFVCTNLLHIHIPDSVKSIGPRAFHSSGLETVHLPASVRILETGSFSETPLRSVVFPEGLVVIRPSAFQGCSSLFDIVLPRSLRFLGYDAFGSCGALRSVTFREGLLLLENCAFASSRALQTVRLPASLESAGNAFDRSIGLDRITLEGRGTDCGSMMYREDPLFVDAPHMLPELLPRMLCPSAAFLFLEKVRTGVPTDPKVQMAWDFFLSQNWYWCRSQLPAWPDGSITSALLQYMVEHRILPETDAYLFWAMCREDGLQTGDQNLFQLPPDPNEAEDPAAWRIVNGTVLSYLGKDGAVRIPDGVTGIAAAAFRGKNVQEVWIPDRVEWIGEEAFADCTGLRSVHLPAGLRMLRRRVFAGCTALESILLPDSLEIIGERAFAGSGLREIALPDSLSVICDEAFHSCSHLEHIRFGEGLLSIHLEAFHGCEALRQVRLPESLICLGEGAFMACSRLEHIVLPDGLKTVEILAFRGCSSLEELTVPAGADGFAGIDAPSCVRLKRLVIPGVPAFTPHFPSSNGIAVVAPFTDPNWLAPCWNHSLLRGFALHGEEYEYRYRDRYLEALSEAREHVWTDPACFRCLIREHLLEREDIPPCLEALQEAGQHALVAELLEYQHRHFPPEDHLPSWLDDDEDSPDDMPE